MLSTYANEKLENKILNIYTCQTLCKALLTGIMELAIITTVL